MSTRSINSSPFFLVFKGVFLGLLFFFYFGAQSASAVISVTSNKNWSSIGATANDDVVVRSGATLTVDVTNGVCKSIVLGSDNAGTSTGILTFSPNTLVTVNGTVTLGATGSTLSTSRYGVINMGNNSTLNCNGLVMQGGGASTITQSTGSNLTVTGNASINNTRAGTNTNIVWNVNSGTATVSGLVTIASPYTTNNYSRINITSGTFNANGGIAFTGSVLSTYRLIDMSGGTGILNIDGGGISNPTNGTFATSTSLSTVNYTGESNQTVGAYAYGNIVFSGSGTKSWAGQLSLKGDFTNNSIFTNSNETILFNGTSLQTVGGSTSSTFSNVTLNNATGIVLATSQTINGTLTFTNGRLNLGNNNLILGASSSIGGTPSAASMIVADGSGELRKSVNSNGSFLFPVGDVTGTVEYSPIQINYNASSYTSAYISVRVMNAKHPNNASTTNYLNRYWKVGSSGITGLNNSSVTATFVPADVAGTVGNQAAGCYTGTLPWNKYATLSGTTLSATGLTTLGDFTGITYAAPTATFVGNPDLTVFINTPLTVTATPVGDAPFTYSWSPGGETTSTLTPSTAAFGSTDYTLNLTDGNGIAGAAVVTVNVAPIKSTATAGATTKYYKNIKQLFDAINNGTQRGTISAEIYGNVVETESAVLNASGTGSASYSSLSIFPAAASISISGNVGGNLIELNGADNVVFDGRVNKSGSTKDLTINNTSIASNAVTLAFNNGAINNTIQYAIVKGGGGTTSNGTVVFGSTGTNSGDKLLNCTLTNNDTRRSNAIFADGGTNTGVELTNNVIYNTWSTTANSNFIYAGTGATDWTISNNSLYETTSLQPSTSATYSAINLNNASNGIYTVSQNYIGGQASQCAGGAMSLGVGGTDQSLIFQPIYLNGSSSSVSSVQGNVIRNLTYRSSNATPFYGISVVGGQANIGTSVGNVLGDTTSTGSVQLTGTAATTTSYGIYVSSSVTVTVANNLIGSVTTSNSNGAYAHGFHAISNTAGGNTQISGNFIGSGSAASSILMSSTATGNPQVLFGIYSNSAGTTTLTGNTVSNLYNATTETNAGSRMYGIYLMSGTNRVINNTVKDIKTGGAASGNNYENVCMTGIVDVSLAGNQVINGNTIYNLKNLSSQKVEFYGIYMTPTTSGNDTIAGNFVHGFSMLSQNTTCYLHGISFVNGTGSFSGSISLFNNVVFLGDSISAGCSIFGLLKNTVKTCNIFHNTVHLGGTVSITSSTSSYAIRDRTDGTQGLRTIKNNIFYNTRSGGGSNYAMYFHVNNNLSIDYNDYGWSGSYFAELNTGGQKLVTLQQWLDVMAGQDTHSLTIDPEFVKMGGILATDYKTNMGLDGVAGLGVATDFGGSTRSLGSPTMGAWECFSVDVYNGATFRASYPTLKGAFDAINAGTHTGNITIKVKGSTLENATAVLNASGSGSASYSQITIRPTRSNVSVINAGSLTGDLIRLNGADNVVFDGRMEGDATTVSLTLVNNSTNATASTVKFVESATNNTLRYCAIKGAESGTTSGVVVFSTATVASGSGNDNNQLSNCLITGTSTDKPANALYALGTTGNENSENALVGNSFENNWIGTSNANSILLDVGNTGWTISGNSFYHTTPFTPSGGYTYSFVYLNAGVHTLSGNYFGGTTIQGLGSTMQMGSTTQSATFYPIQLNVASAGSGTSVQGNYIGNLLINSTAGTQFAALKVIGGKVNIGTVTPNQIGFQTGNGNILITSTNTNATSYGFYLAGPDSIRVANNTFGSITATNSNAANAHSFTAIYATGAATVIIQSNTIGSSSTSGSIQAASASTGADQAIRGIHYEGTGSVQVQQNTITNLTNNSTYNNATNRVTGIHKAGTGTGRIVQNFITGLTNGTTASVVNPILEGIHLDNGPTFCANNVLSVGSTSPGYFKVYGIRETGVAYVDSIYHNTVYVSGNVTGTAAQALSYCFYKGSNNGSSYILNNIFYNTRNSGASGSGHYGVYIPSVSSVPVMNGNDYYTSGTYTRLGRLNTTDYTSIGNWRTATGREANGTEVNPNLVNAGGSSPADYKTSVVLNGVPYTIAIDFGNNSRTVSAPTIGAWEYTLCVEIYNGATFKKAYTTLKGAFDAINAGTYTGNLTIKIVKSTYENNTASLSASGSGSASYSRVLIYPTGPSLSVTGSINGPLISFSGAVNVTLDGRVNANGSSADLLVSNSSIGTTASTVQYIGAAQGDTLQYCFIKGAGQGTAAGTINFSTASATPGNSNNVIRYCKISGTSVSDRPINALYSGGSSGFSNASNQIIGNQFFNTLSPAASSNVIHLNEYSTGFTISNNSLFETATFTATAGNEYALIRIASSTGQNFMVSGNYLGGSESGANGTWVKVGTGSTFYGMFLNVGATTATNVQGNVLRNINYSNVGNNTFTGIHVNGGLVNIGTQSGNTIGATSGNASLVISNSTNDGSVYGIAINGTDAVQCSNNSIGAITTSNTSSVNATNLYGIYKGAVAGSMQLHKNVIGSLTTANSLYASSDAYNSSQLVYGIYSNGTGTVVIDSNSVVNVTNKTLETIQQSKTVGIYIGGGTNTINGNTVSVITSGGAANGSSGENAPSLGLLVKSTLTGQLIYGNSVSRIRNNTTARLYAYGIYYSGPTSGTNQLYGNFVNRMLLPSAPPESYVTGLYLAQGAAQVYNNIIAIGDSLLQGLTLYGLYNNSANTLTFYHNTLYVGGTVAAAMSNTYAFLDNVTSTRTLSNNLLSNQRSGGGKHYAISLAGTSGLTINYNNYYAGGTNGILGYQGSDRTTLDAWKTATSQDVSSMNLNPAFVLPGSTRATDYTPTTSLTVSNAIISDDYLGMSRQSTPTVGALEFVGYIWLGAVDTDWSKPDNWSLRMVPTLSINTIIPNRVNKPTINSGVAAQANKLNIYTGAVVTIDAGGSLTVASTVTNNTGSGGLIINSTEQGTGSFICSQNGVLATVRRFIRRQSARNSAWFTLSSPITAQTIRGTEWTPSGGFADGTGYDLFVWDEATSAWIYNLNESTTTEKKWSDAHPQTYFVPGRGYLYSLYDSISTKSFVGTLNNGNITVPLTILGTGSNKGFQLVGNPYPSSMDWKASSGFDRSKLTLSGSGYDLWMWSSTAKNFGVYNSSDPGDVGTLNASRYIAPMQGFFVNASLAGNLVLDNGTRVHNSAGSWLRSAEVSTGGMVRLNVVSSSDNGSDEVMLRFGANTDDGGSAKLFSPVREAPSLYMPVKNKEYSIRNLTTFENNTSIPVSFKAGTADTYTMTCVADESLSDNVLLEDKRTGIIHNFSESGTYTYSATPGDASDRFVLHYGSASLNPGLAKYRIYVSGSTVVVNLEEVSGEYTVTLIDVDGRIQQRRTMFGGSINTLPLVGRGVYLVSIQTVSGVYNQKVVY